MGIKADAFKYEIKTETSEKEFWHEVWQETPTALKDEFVRNERKFYSSKTVKEILYDIQDKLDLEVDGDVYKDIEQIMEEI